jgi:aspartate racemase
MRQLALLGGMTYGATSIYYNLINREIQRRLGGANSATLLIQSFNHAEMQDLFEAGQWLTVTKKFSTAARNLKAAGAEGVMICCNIGHKVAADVERECSGLEVLHIVDSTGKLIRERGFKKVALIATKPVMEEAFFKERLREKFGIEVVVPGEEAREAIHTMIFTELGANVFHDGQKDILKGAIDQCVRQGAEGAIFACTELQFVVKQEDVSVPLWDTMEGHARGAVEWMLDGEDVGR